MSQYNDQCAAIRESLSDAGYKDVNVNTVVASQG
jgi:superfamily I DNA and/or RNA helicase